ncbi:hypothetical protein M885DRAFT_586755 [Pelagophyceae sp. CCMP2097]|nr:hypothetical protein M885DRAFT_586755 [Pelagophyceae sp. CCMP2097]
MMAWWLALVALAAPANAFAPLPPPRSGPANAAPMPRAGRVAKRQSQAEVALGAWVPGGSTAAGALRRSAAALRRGAEALRGGKRQKQALEDARTSLALASQASDLRAQAVVDREAALRLLTADRDSERDLAVRASTRALLEKELAVEAVAKRRQAAALAAADAAFAAERNALAAAIEAVEANALATEAALVEDARTAEAKAVEALKTARNDALAKVKAVEAEAVQRVAAAEGRASEAAAMLSANSAALADLVAARDAAVADVLAAKGALAEEQQRATTLEFKARALETGEQIALLDLQVALQVAKEDAATARDKSAAFAQREASQKRALAEAQSQLQAALDSASGTDKVTLLEMTAKHNIEISTLKADAAAAAAAADEAQSAALRRASARAASASAADALVSAAALTAQQKRGFSSLLRLARSNRVASRARERLWESSVVQFEKVLADKELAFAERFTAAEQESAKFSEAQTASISTYDDGLANFQASSDAQLALEEGSKLESAAAMAALKKQTAEQLEAVVSKLAQFKNEAAQFKNEAAFYFTKAKEDAAVELAQANNASAFALAQANNASAFALAQAREDAALALSQATENAAVALAQATDAAANATAALARVEKRERTDKERFTSRLQYESDVNVAVDTATRVMSLRKDRELLSALQMVRAEKTLAIEEIRTRAAKNEATALAKFRVENSALAASAAVDAAELVQAKKKLKSAEILKADLAIETKAVNEAAFKERKRLQALISAGESVDVAALREDFKKQIADLEHKASLELAAVGETAAAASAALEQALEASASVSVAQQSLFEATTVAAKTAADDVSLEKEALEAAAVQLAAMSKTLESKINTLEVAAKKAEAERVVLEAEVSALKDAAQKAHDAAEAAVLDAEASALEVEARQAETAALKTEILEMDNGFEQSTTLLKQQFDAQLQKKIADFSARGDSRA